MEEYGRDRMIMTIIYLMLLFRLVLCCDICIVSLKYFFYLRHFKLDFFYITLHIASCVCACVSKWPAVVKTLMDKIQRYTGITFNSLLANLYRDGHDHVSWHADDEPSLGHHPTIASLSFGDTRTFHLRKNPPPVRVL